MQWSPTLCKEVAADLLRLAPERWRHVERVAGHLGESRSGDTEADLLQRAAWLHDIGYAPDVHGTGMHAIDGATFLDRSGAPQELVGLVAFHTGAEFEAEERGLIGPAPPVRPVHPRNCSTP